MAIRKGVGAQELRAPRRLVLSIVFGTDNPLPPPPLHSPLYFNPNKPMMPIMTGQKQTLEHSDFSGEFIEDDVVVRIDIYRVAGSADGWTLEVIDHTGASSVWDDAFATDQAAYEEFLATVQRDGIETFLDEPVTLLH